MLPLSVLDIEALGALNFHDPLHTRDIVLLNAWGVRVNDVTYRAPAGMLSDGGSIPRFFWRLIDPPLYTLLRPAIVLHDAAYQGVLRATAPGRDWLPVEKDEADELLEMIGRWNGACTAKAWTVYQAVNLFGGWAWEYSHARHADVLPQLLDYVPAPSSLPPPWPTRLTS